MSQVSMRKEWFIFVAKTRKKMAREQKKPVSHRDAMRSAALLWTNEKVKILNRQKREERKRIKLANKDKSTAPSQVA